MHNLYDLSSLEYGAREIFETIVAKRDLRIERIVTMEPYSSPGEWYDQELDEWVVLLQGSATLEFLSGNTVELKPGDHLLIPAHEIHRVNRTPDGERCIWLAVHGKFK